MIKRTNKRFNDSTIQQSKSKRVRLITICGSIQLVSAIAAIRTKEAKERLSAEGFENILLFYNLNQDCPEATRLFQETLEKMARKLFPISKILKSESLYPLPTTLYPLPTTLYPLPSTPNEIWVNSDFHKEIKILCNHFDQAKVITYGDGPGIYFTKKCRFIFPQNQNKRSNFNPIGTVKSLIKTLGTPFVPTSLRGKKKQDQVQISPPLKSIIFDEGFFLFPSAFDEQPTGFPYTEMAADTFVNIFKEIKPLFDFSFLEKVLEGITILLTANLSEANRMEEADELQAYENVLKEHHAPNDLIMIKPHPRDGQEKIKKLKAKLKQTFKNIKVIEGPTTQYIPFELFVLHLLEHQYENLDSFKQKVRIITTSTSCLSLAKLYGIKCIIGLEEKDIRQYFRPDRIEDRLAHNRVLQQIVDSCLIKSSIVAAS